MTKIGAPFWTISEQVRRVRLTVTQREEGLDSED